MSPETEDDRADRTRRSEVRTFWIAMAVSVGLHLLFLLLYPRTGIDVGAVSLPASGGDSAPAEGIEVVRIVERADDPADDATTPTPAPPPEQPSGDPGGEAGEAAPSDRGGEATPNAPLGPAVERLRPRMEDARLWQPVDATEAMPSDHEVAMREIRAELEAWNDSVASAGAAAEDAMDWTHTDAQGRRWGISPGRIHLGPITIPVSSGGPIFLPPPGKREEVERRRWQWEEIGRQGVDGRRRQIREERQRGIRERRSGERADSTGGG